MTVQLDKDALVAAMNVVIHAHPTQHRCVVISDAIQAYLAIANKPRPIESARRDKHILAWEPNWNCWVVVEYDDSMIDGWYEVGTCDPANVSHWFPLPEPYTPRT